MSALTRLVLATMPLVPTPIMRRLAGRYIAGERLEQAITALTDLAAEGFPGILDILGEGQGNEDHARAASAAYLAAARAVAQGDLDAYISVKPTHFGLLLGGELAFELYDGLARECAALGLDLRVEMEDHPTTDATLELFGRLRREHANIGLVLQSRLLRTPVDIEALLAGSPAAAGRLDVRMVKGIYLEPAEVAHVDPQSISDAFLDCCSSLWAGGARVTLATHDEVLATRLTQALSKGQLTTADYEFQVLLGVRRQLWQSWRAAGHPVRVYVPFGPEWRAYSQRRLQKNPQLIGHIMGNFLRR
ncbi:MAG: proline dehydrogenase family protein [Planctomycetota bacterium]|jgi:proline dehydrogenase|nr:hypothetical protein [Planctomycetota bacterium]MDP6368325.1 proline dehydrogenase family protein [Planctomycetota bacterium]MDP6519600.1 proline dehydrogenase family protein [Planctomycetota bacterium]MDP6839601.1 proline dehydrogenase family protein [Planctomycetota bacterium]MDP6955309.1 proline dehydrogenase family protein [Planctomycetota bacterium]